jgi:OOP family OmpA-OmpF porin
MALREAPKGNNRVNTTVPAPGTVKEHVDRMVFNFDYNKTEPIYSEETAASLRALCSAMQNDASMRVVVIGHTDNVGTMRNNITMGRMRANAVKKLMIDLGAPAENIAIVTRGEKEPEESNKTEEGRAHNRRATVEIE